MNIKTVSVKQVKSKIGRPKSHQACLAGLGIRRSQQTVIVPATAENLGMIRKVAYMLEVEGK